MWHYTPKMEEICRATQNNAAMQKVITFIRKRWPQSFHPCEDFTVRAHLSESDGLILYHDRIVIPTALRSNVLKQLHEGHQALTKCC